ncbi:ferredoxin [Mycolicibacterium farcinogenes]|uniref:Ferredoxin n=2 Tax=Mycobacteriaceae TaxID=1762 RepID=A0A378W619_9MYCO|nr:ferredoxin [Mycolicibacterium senegalense]CDP86696.1 ferredoxin [Mycolicibacterium farcinogenes]SUA28527.1 ferredoxin [Mycolicibacterium senegalense]
MKISVDHDLCLGSALCTGLVPDVFDLAEDGTLVVLTDKPDVALLNDIEEAVRSCPVRALRLDRDPL